MCIDWGANRQIDRRRFLVAGGAAIAWTTLGDAHLASASSAHVPAQVPVEVAPGLVVLRRESWGADLPAPAGLPTEAPGDVRVLLVHHSASANGYDEAAVVNKIRQFHAMHTGPEKGWPDVAYNFFVDRFGRVWEGRSGSLDGPVIGDATGGSQGHSQLVCLIGDFSTEEPSPEAVDALSRVLAWISQRDGVDVTAGATTSFVSRGSNRWPAGATVDTTTVAGHRDMSRTACPGDTAYARVRGDLPALVAQRSAELTSAAAPPAPTSTAPPTSSPPTTPTPQGDDTEQGAPPASFDRVDGGGGIGAPLVAGAAALVTIAVAGPIAMRRRQAEDGDTPETPLS